ncbi:hypothetical protein B0H12DRAFT_51521 [Mycena haematopus]|nr:hypothetical protein B0H12DRAFT_51521 [Mycena haematopus]
MAAGSAGSMLGGINCKVKLRCILKSIVPIDHLGGPNMQTRLFPAQKLLTYKSFFPGPARPPPPLADVGYSYLRSPLNDTMSLRKSSKEIFCLSTLRTAIANGKLRLLN